MTDAGYVTASPVFTVGGDLDRDLGRDCLRLEVAEDTGGLRTARAHFRAVAGGVTGPPGPMLHLDGSTLGLGRSLQVSVGPDGGQRRIFDGTVSGVEAQFQTGELPIVVIYAEDALMRLRMHRGIRSFTQVTDGSIAASIAKDHGLDADVTSDGPEYDVVQQVNQSDLAFLRERARLIQAEIWCTGTTLHFKRRTEREGTQLTLVQGNQLTSVRLCADLAHQRSEVVVTGYDANAKRGIQARAGESVLTPEVTGGTTGPGLVASALGGPVKGAAVTFRVREAALASGEARAWAEAEMLRRARRFVTAEGSTHGSADLVVGSLLTLELVGAPFEGDGYYVTRVVHTFDRADGFRTRFTAERPTVNEVA